MSFWGPQAQSIKLQTAPLNCGRDDVMALNVPDATTPTLRVREGNALGMNPIRSRSNMVCLTGFATCRPFLTDKIWTTMAQLYNVFIPTGDQTRDVPQ